jgi:RNA polymerase sigma factor (TIGR02999 family)
VTHPVTAILHRVEAGERDAAAELLPLVYDELRKLAVSRMADLPRGQTLQPTALVHEAYMHLVGGDDPGWEGRRHFFGAAARAMRNILVDRARRKAAVKHGGGRQRVSLDGDDDGAVRIDVPVEDVLALEEALADLERDDPEKAEIVMLRYFVGLDREATAAALGISTRTLDRHWRFIAARMHRAMHPGAREESDE